MPGVISFFNDNDSIASIFKVDRKGKSGQTPAQYGNIVSHSNAVMMYLNAQLHFTE
jgi:hypothetical protein